MRGAKWTPCSIKVVKTVKHATWIDENIAFNNAWGRH
jgi:hypothetical protein